MVVMAEISNWFRSTETRIRKYVKNQKQLIIKLKGTVPCINLSWNPLDFLFYRSLELMWSPHCGLEGAMSRLDGRSARKPLEFRANETLSLKMWVWIHHFLWFTVNHLLETGKVVRRTSNFKWLLKQGWYVMTSPKMVKMVKNVQIMKFGFAAKKKKTFHVCFIGLHSILSDQILNGCHPMIAVVKGHTIPT